MMCSGGGSVSFSSDGTAGDNCPSAAPGVIVSPGVSGSSLDNMYAGTATAAAAMMSITAADMPTTLAIVSFLLIYTNIAFVSDCARNIVTHILYHAPDRKASVNMN